MVGDILSQDIDMHSQIQAVAEQPQLEYSDIVDATIRRPHS